MARGEELVPVACGDGDLDPGETCDDGNTNNGDGCSAQCQIEVPVCGDGNVDPEIGEECDDGNTVDGDGCSANCTIEPYCGDGTVDPGEQCDDGNNTNGDGCSASCEIENEAPVCDDATAAISSIWPPNHKMVSVGPITGVTDPDGDPVKITVTHIMQDEPTNTQGDGNTSCDATTAPLQVRAERSGNRDGRFYHAVFTATDPGGLSCTGSVVVAVVPHDQSHAPVDQGPLYNSCPAP
jgi:cysteine-rich repeat protein